MAPTSTILDETYKIAITRFDDRIRVGGMAEVAGFDLSLSPKRRATLEMVVGDLYPRGGDLSRASFWTGLRPATPDGTPAVGATSSPNLFLNTGHGTLGWTMACGSGRYLADLMASRMPQISGEGLPKIFWIYLVGVALVAAGFADYPLIAYHFGKTHTVPSEWIAVFYAVAMAVSGTGSLAFGRLFDRFGFKVLVVLTLVAALFAPLVFLGGFWTALIGAAIWGVGFGVHESIIPAAVAPMVPVQRRASAFGLFTAGYGLSWFLGSAAIGILYDASLPATIGFCVVTQLSAIPIFIIVGRHQNEDSFR